MKWRKTNKYYIWELVSSILTWITEYTLITQYIWGLLSFFPTAHRESEHFLLTVIISSYRLPWGRRENYTNALWNKSSFIEHKRDECREDWQPPPASVMLFYIRKSAGCRKKSGCNKEDNRRRVLQSQGILRWEVVEGLQPKIYQIVTQRHQEERHGEEQHPFDTGSAKLYGKCSLNLEKHKQ